MQNLFIIHSYNADTKESFGLDLQKKAEELGLKVYFPDFPTRKNARYNSWREIMDGYRIRDELNSESIIVAHSLGAHFIPKYISESNISIKMYVSCAGFLNDHSGRQDLQEIVNDFKPTDEQIERFIGLCNSRFSIYSNNDHMNPQEELENYADRFCATRVFVPDVGHMGKSSGIKELPKVIELINAEVNNNGKKGKCLYKL